ncbi:MAG: YceD family protein [Azoarcus sp.]|jgi:uncharacterized protein|nr:YceD family protein [Azoarcus sp.]
MSEQKPPGRIVDVFRFALEGGKLEGEMPVAAFGRLADQLAGNGNKNGGAVRWRLAGCVDAEGKPRLDLGVTGRLTLLCQRCLGELEWELVLDAALRPVRTGQTLPEDELENDEVDAIEFDGEVDVLSLIEDEIILALPIAPRHADCGILRPEQAAGGADFSPFAALAGLRGKGRTA